VEPAAPRLQLKCGKDCAVCAVCFSRTQVARACAPTADCPLCNDGSAFAQWNVLCKRATEAATRSANRQTADPFAELSPALAPNKDRDPVRHHENIPAEQRDNFLGVTLTLSHEGGVVPRSAMFLKDAPTVEMGEEQIHVLEDFQQTVHGLAITNDRADRDRAFFPGGDPCRDDGATLHHCAAEDHSVQRRSVHMLACGEPLRNCRGFTDPTANVEWQKLSTTAFALTDMIRYLRNKEYPGLVKSTAGSLLPARSVCQVWAGAMVHSLHHSSKRWCVASNLLWLFVYLILTSLWLK